MNVLLLRDVVAILLAGGAGERLYPLTRERAKPAVPFGGPYRIIDFTLSNCVNSGLRKIIIATQYKAQSLNRHVRLGWNVVNRVLDDDGFDAAARAFARQLADGPTRAHAATKAIVRGQLEGGVREADARVPQLAGDLFATDDLKGAVRSFLEQGPGHATYEGR